MSTTTAVPGGNATFYTADEITPRRGREVEKLMLQMGDLLQRIRSASKVTAPDGTVSDKTDDPEYSGLPIMLTEVEADLFAKLTDVITWAYLQSWTVKVPAGNALIDLPIPVTPDALLDLPGPLYRALIAVGQKIAAGKIEEFDVSTAALEDQASPTGV